MKHTSASLRRLWFQWVAANAIAEFVGLGAVAAVGFLVVQHFADPQTWQQALLLAALFIGLGAFEGFAVGVAQGAVLRRALPSVRGWTRATVVGAMVAWAVGMLPSIMAGLLASPSAEPAAEPPLWLVLLLAAGLGAVAGPALAGFQWYTLRRARVTRAWLWLPANAAAWSLGMPIIFVGAQANEVASSTGLIAVLVGLALLAAGAVVGAVHGWFLLRLVEWQDAEHVAERFA